MNDTAAIDFDHLNGWIGRTETVADIVTPGLVDRFRATFGKRLYGDPQSVPLGLHWCLAPPAVPLEEIGPDGHPARGGFLPPVPLENRMWAGGAVSFHAPLQIGDEVTRASRIAAITPKNGRSGPLVFVTVEHELHVGNRRVIEERQDIVYRPARSVEAAQPEAVHDIPEDAFVGDPVTLFRYSAMTFNGHRIHYDYPYVTQQEGYSGLVVHGPIQATLLMNAAAAAAQQDAIRIEYRGLSPLIAGQPVSIKRDDKHVWLEKPDATATFDARYSLL
ncbi:FAS1-like dehydratase domain-containing protein [Pontivivens nitratireducens]|uniref:Protein dehydratase n=1 Tax=Pontivivens nitratireducens TaxID=2758038 RepID=A0A6G7VLA7_9RHOB|nr:MaoC family dehydratase N-terminal domain-containing protein [Pontibrevibacter nitratireducens]QIK40577.1 protein dehydratase [Pontibrevibacter nitratireducens]